MDDMQYETSTGWRPATHEESARLRSMDAQEGGQHYKDMSIEPLEFFLANSTPDQVVAIMRQNVTKYIWRNKAGGSRLQDFKKARHYLDICIEHLEQGGDDAA